MGLRALFFAFLAFVFIVLDHHSHWFHRVHQDASVIVYPVEVLVSAPIRGVEWIAHDIVSRQNLINQNTRLKANALLLHSKLQHLLLLKAQNKQLKALLQSSASIPGHERVVDLLAVDLDPVLKQIVLSLGHSSGVYVGQPVLDAYGVMGQVVSVNSLTSTAMLITDKRSAIPVRDYQTGMRAIAVGSGDGMLHLVDVPKTAKIKLGDLFVTSGLGLRFPAGYPVGGVVALGRSAGSNFAQVSLQPAAHIHRSTQLLLVWPSKAQEQKQVEVKHVG